MIATLRAVLVICIKVHPQVAGARAPGERACRWCRGCAKQHPGAVDALAKKCEACALKHYLKRGTARSL
jgi:hypothetical protein